MDPLLAALRACAEPTRLRILALATSGAFCVVELTDILGQSQPRLSRHLRRLCDARILERVREGANVWFGLPPEATPAFALVHQLLAHLPPDDPVIAADRRAAARVLAERARIASESFRKQGADWDEMRALALPAADIEAALLSLLPAKLDRVLDIGTGTGRMLELLAPRTRSGLGVDASRAMLALARARLAKPGLSHLSVRQADMYSLPLTQSYDLVLLHMVLHYAEDPQAALAEAARALRPGGRLIVVDLAPHDRAVMTDRLAHRWPGFEDAHISDWLRAAHLHPARTIDVAAPLAVRLWTATADPVAPQLAPQPIQAPTLEFAQ